MKLHEIHPPKGAKKKKKRLGKGSSSGHGGTCGKGSKGQRSRSGSKNYSWFEGGQMPLQRRVPKRGMTPRNKVIFQIVTLKELNQFDDNTIVDVSQLKKKGFIKSEKRPVKILGDGSLAKSLTVMVDSFSKKAREQIIARGGKAEIKSA